MEAVWSSRSRDFSQAVCQGFNVLCTKETGILLRLSGRGTDAHLVSDRSVQPPFSQIRGKLSRFFARNRSWHMLKNIIYVPYRIPMASEYLGNDSRAGVFEVPYRYVRLVCVGLGVLAWGLSVPNSAVAEFDTSFFENKIRPVLAARCYSCHGAEKADGGLRLDMLAETPPVSVNTVLQQRYAGPHPPVELAASERESIRAWIAQGAHWPAPVKNRYARGTMTDYVKTMRTEHWSFRPVDEPVPITSDDAAASPIDLYVGVRLDAAELALSPQADKQSLIRRAYHDLIGLPPTLAEITAFEADPSEEAFTHVVEELLASPHFGERWGRHWLDVARYSDTKGSSFREDRLFPFSHTYRDYVIRAFNEDLGYDRFILEQIAADQLELNEDKSPLAALGFLTLGKSFGANVHDRIDDRIDVVTRGLQGLTVNCARCHDHKFDPIPTADYYSLYGIFRSSQEPGELPLIETPDEDDPGYQAYLEGLAKVEAARDGLQERLHVELLAHARENVGAYLEGIAAHWNDADGTGLADFAKDRGLRPELVTRWKSYLASDEMADDPIFGFWRSALSLDADAFEDSVSTVLAALAANREPDTQANRVLLRHFEDHPPATQTDVSAGYGGLLSEIDRNWQDLIAARLQRQQREGDGASELPSTLDDPSRESLRQVLYGTASPVNVPFSDVYALSPREDRVRTNQRSQAVALFKNSHPGRPSRAMALEDSPSPFAPYVFERGDATSKGKDVPRQFLAVLSGDDREPFSNGSGRLELAQSIADRENPLTARVFVNRIWAQLFDRPIVGTPSDFGTQGNAPTHPELLDYLAWRFMEGGWSTKSLLREIMMSDTYQQSSDLRADGEAVDAENKLLWRQNRRRLSFEAMRDSLLAAAGNIDLTVGGLPTNVVKMPFSNRRTVYAEVDRHALPAMFRIFDFATPNEHTPMRFETTVPQQALYLMNSPFVTEQARNAVAQNTVATVESPEERVRALYHSVLRREPTKKELALGVMFVKGQDVAQRQPPEKRDTTWRYGYGTVDEVSGQVAEFTEFPHWNGEEFRESDEMPGPTLGMAMLNRLGGHPGSTEHAVIRRWTSAADTLVSCVGELYHHSSAGDGIRAYIVSSRSGILWQGDVQDGIIATVFDDVEIGVGDTIDLVVSCRDNDEEDAFRWHPRLYLSGENATQFEKQDWITRFDFEGPPPAPPEPLKPWEQYAQVLLMSNEFMFVD
jgi:hypothetical protein